MPAGVAIALIAASLLVLFGAARAGVEFGNAGLIAYAKLVLSPVVIAAILWFWAFPALRDGKWVWLPSRREQLVLLWLVCILTSLFIVAGALFGVAWLVHS